MIGIHDTVPKPRVLDKNLVKVIGFEQNFFILNYILFLTHQTHSDNDSFHDILSC